MNLNLENLHLGAVTERFDDALRAVIENILDKNTDPKVKRKISIDVIISPSPEDREVCSLEVKVFAKLAAPKTLVSSVTIGMDRRTGEMEAIESVPRQGSLFPPPVKSVDVVKMQANG